MAGGELLTRWTVRAALGLYVLALALRLAAPRRRGLARAAWTAGCLLFLAHVAAAFHYFHGWSHGDAYRETARQTGEMVGTYWGGGLYLNYLFTLAWAADAAYWWWRGTNGYAARSRWIDWLLHGFMGFIAVNAAVVFETGFVRAAGVGASALLVVLALRRLRRGAADRDTTYANGHEASGAPLPLASPHPCPLPEGEGDGAASSQLLRQATAQPPSPSGRGQG